MSLNQPDAQIALQGIHSRAMAVVNMNNLENKNLAHDQIRLESNLMMLNFKDALKEKYLTKTGHHGYGLKDEGKTMGMLRGKISSSLNSYKRNITR